MDVLWFSPIDLGAIPGFLAAFSKKNVTGWIFDRISAAKEFGAQDRPSATEPDSAQRGGERR